MQAMADAALAASAADAKAAPAAAEEDPGMDDWAAALAEQNQQPVQAGATGAGVFQPLSKAASTSTHN
ncbi:flagellar motor switch protein FliN, partial [Escherichia coli]|nr:flagellar motor switch protein FliN [Escherichia coli]